MKINERTLLNYSNNYSGGGGSGGNSGNDKEGYLWKRGEVNKNFQKRYFVLKGNLLFYFDKKGEKEAIGVIILEGCTIELAEDEQEKFAFKIVFHGEGRRSYTLGTEQQEVLEDWMKLLSCASFDYMKLMVMELQQQLSELEEAEKATCHENSSLVTSSHNRSNPFDHRDFPHNKRGTLIDLSPNTLSSTRSKKSWQTIHCEYGSKISSDRQAWIAKHLN